MEVELAIQSYIMWNPILSKKFLKSLMDEKSKRILVHGNFGYGTTTPVEYVLQTYANDLQDHFFGEILKWNTFLTTC